MEGYNSFVSKSFVARQNCIQFGTNLNFAKLVRFYQLFYRAILSREEIDCRGVKKWRKVSWINLEQRWGKLSEGSNIILPTEVFSLFERGKY